MCTEALVGANYLGPVPLADFNFSPNNFFYYTDRGYAVE